MTLIVEIALGIVLGIALLGVGTLLFVGALRALNTWTPPTPREKGFLGLVLALIGNCAARLRALGGTALMGTVLIGIS
jgi:hypothetical protein